MKIKKLMHCMVAAIVAVLLIMPGLVTAADSTLIFYIHLDHLDTPRLISNQGGNVVWTWDSDAFGQAAPNEQPSTQPSVRMPLRFPGQYADTESNLHYNYFRDYDPQMGRYIQSDPIGLSGGINTFAYVESDPLRFSDPRGLVKHTSGRTISCGNCTIRIDYTFDEKNGTKRNHLHWNCKGKEGACGEYGEKSHGEGSWDDAPDNVKECARKAGFQGDSLSSISKPSVKLPQMPWWTPLLIPAIPAILSQ